MLSALGVDTTSEAVYRTMLDQPDWGVAEIGVHLARSEGEVRAALDRLTELRLLRPRFSDSSVLRPVGLDVGVQILLARREEEVRRVQEEFAAGQAAALEFLEAQAAEGGAEHRYEELSSIDRIQDRLEHLTHSCRRLLLSFHPGGAQPRAQLEASKPLDAALLGRGVAMRTLYQDSVRNDQDTFRYARWLTESGGQVRTVPVLPIRMVLFDDTAALLPVDPANTAAGAVQFSGPGVITALTALHEAVWEHAAPFGTDGDRGREREQERSEEEVTGQERQMLKLLGQGMTDEVAARHLGIGVRTARRMMASLMQRLGARSRFEAGMLAERRGWLGR
ncbi:helix-turn-helix transcriptional regulator [Streptomyces sp. CC208A]|uniref:helix-turn-helix transcriptional regulator n=1 Tax=Streptomyces sp. CC208A TaxID=3044573 RepID=UPI0024A9BBE5|nr:helix-turn-helix transcriptional regulator [Streptomyces sp. CC208A]